MASEGPWFLHPSPMATLREQYTSRMKRLHEKVEELTERVSVKGEEQQRRQAALLRVMRVVGELWPASKLETFGSEATGLTLAGLSDIDVVIVGCVRHDIRESPLKTLAVHLVRKGVCVGTPDVKDRARVPVLRFTEAQSRVEFDVSMEEGVAQTGRLHAQKTEWIKQKLREIPPLRPLYMALKLFMYQKELNMVYERGGLNSYTLFVMLAAYLQMQAREPTNRSGGIRLTLDNLGVLLVGFFHFYGGGFFHFDGSRLNTEEYGVSCRNGGYCFKKVERGAAWRSNRLLAVEDPLDPTHDLGKVAYSFKSSIQPAFEEAYRSLTAFPYFGRILAQVVGVPLF